MSYGRAGRFTVYARYGAGLIIAQLLLAWFGTLAWHHWTDQQYERYVRGQLRGTTALLLERLSQTPQSTWPAVMSALQVHFAYPVALTPLPEAARALDPRRATPLAEGAMVVDADASHAYQRVPGTDTVIVFGNLDSVTEPTPTGRPGLLAAWLALLFVVIIALAAPFYVLLYRLLRDMQSLDTIVRTMLENTFHTDLPPVRTHLLRPLALALQDIAVQMRSTLDGQRLMSQAMAHEIRTPLTRLRFSCELLGADRPARGAAAQLHADMCADIDHLQELVRAGLEYARFGRMPLVERSTVVLRSLVDNVWKQLCQGAGPRLDSIIEPGLAAHANTPALELAVRNVLANARRHARHRVSVHAHADTAVLRIEVHDDGPGIASGMVDRIFEPYVRLDTAGTGFGLGLAMVRSIMRKHGGDVTASRSVLGGACLSLWLPACPVSRPAEG